MEGLADEVSAAVLGDEPRKILVSPQASVHASHLSNLQAVLVSRATRSIAPSAARIFHFHSLPNTWAWTRCCRQKRQQVELSNRAEVISSPHERRQANPGAFRSSSTSARRPP